MSYCLCRLGKEKKPQGEIQVQHRPTEGTGRLEWPVPNHRLLE